MGVHPRTWQDDDLPVYDTEPLGGCAGLLVACLLLAAVALLLGVVWLAVQ